MKAFKDGIQKGLGILLVFGTAVFAYNISGTVKTWSSGETLTAADLNQTVQSLKTSVENAAQFYEAGGGYYHSANTYQWGSLLGIGGTAIAEKVTSMPRAGKVKNFTLKPTSNTVDAACTLTLRKNSVGTTIAVTIPAGSTTQISDADTVEFIAGDNLGWYIACPGFTTGSVSYDVSFEF
jgi:hypothetical protein